MNDIVEILKQNQLRKLARSESFAKAQETSIDNKLDTAKHVITGENPNPSLPVEIVYIRDKYYNMLNAYKGSGLAFSREMTGREITLWTRAEKARVASGCDIDRYLKAQFVWFDKAFGKAPTPVQLTTDTAVERAAEFAGTTVGKVLSNSRSAPVTKADTFRESEKTIQKVMIAQSCNREEFYRRFVLTGLFLLPKEFLGADPTYQRLISE